MVATRPLSVAQAVADQRFRLRVTLGFALAGTAVIAGLVAALAMAGRSVALVAPIGCIFPIIAWRWPASSVALLVLASTLVEQFRLPARLPQHLTDAVPLFRSLSSQGLSGVYVTPVEILLATILLSWMARAIVSRRLALTGSGASLALLALSLTVLVGEIRGVGTGGVVQESLNEVRPFLYLATAFVLASALTTRLSHLNWFLWAAVLGTGFKGVQGSVRFLAVRGVYPRPQEILEHEEAVFMTCFILLVALLWILDRPGSLRRVATALLPFVVLADMANNRRTAWVILAAGVVLVAVVAWIRQPERRRLTAGLAAGLAIVASVYLPLFWNSQSVLAEPAKAAHSAIAPNARDLSSDGYRLIEDANLGLDIKNSPFGIGFGKPIANPLPIVDLSRIDPSIAFIPHNTVLYLWLRLGTLGMLAFWWLVAAGVLASVTSLRMPDSGVAVFAAFALIALVAVVIEGWYDMGLEAYRLSIFLGVLLGGVDAAFRLQRVAAGRGRSAWQTAGHAA